MKITHVRQTNKLPPDRSPGRQRSTRPLALPATQKAHKIFFFFLQSTSSVISLLESSSWFQGLVSSLLHRHLPPLRLAWRHSKANVSLGLGSDIQDNRAPFSWQPPWQEDSGWASQTNHYLKSAAYNQIRYPLPKKCVFKKRQKPHYFVSHLFLHIDLQLQRMDNRTLECIFSLLFKPLDQFPRGLPIKSYSNSKRQITSLVGQ